MGELVAYAEYMRYETLPDQGSPAAQSLTLSIRDTTAIHDHSLDADQLLCRAGSPTKSEDKDRKSQNDQRKPLMRGHHSLLNHGPISSLRNIGCRMLVQESFPRLDLWREQDVSNWLRTLDNEHRPERKGWRPSSPGEKPLLQTLLTDINSEKRKGSSALIVERGDWQLKFMAMLAGHAPCNKPHTAESSRLGNAPWT